MNTDTKIRTFNRKFMPESNLWGTSCVRDTGLERKSCPIYTCIKNKHNSFNHHHQQCVRNSHRGETHTSAIDLAVF
jgi:hypothetical protein